MATKWKNYSRAWYIKLIAWILVLSSFSGIITLVWYGKTKYSEFPNLSEEDYLLSSKLLIQTTQYSTALVEKVVYDSMQKKYSDEVIDAQMKNAYLTWKSNSGYVEFILESNENGKIYDISLSYLERDYEENSDKKIEKDLSYKAFEKEYPNLRSQLQECMETNLQEDNESNEEFLDFSSDFQYFVEEEENETEWKQKVEEYKTYPYYILYVKGTEIYHIQPMKDETIENDSNYEISDSNTVDSFRYAQIGDEESDMPFVWAYDEEENEVSGRADVVQIYRKWMAEETKKALNKVRIGIGLDEETVMSKQKELSDVVQMTRFTFVTSIICTLILCIGIVYLIVTTGWNDRDDMLHLNWFDNIWSEVQIGVLFFVIVGAIPFLSFILHERFYQPYYYEEYYGDSITMRYGANMIEYFGTPIACTIVILGSAIGALVAGTIILSQVRRLKARKYLKNSVASGFISIRVLKSISKKFIAVITGGKFTGKLVLLAIFVPIISATWMGLPFVIAFLLYLAYRYGEDIDCLQQGINVIRQGDLQHKIKIKHDNVIRDIANDVNSISDGLKNAIDSELRSERMKAELISNVSHDIKTPLTSIITYVDLLKKEEIENEVARDYILVIDKKAQRLKSLTNDLFDAAKASSGDMPVHLDKVNMQSLIQQSLGEFNDKLSKANLAIRVTAPEYPIYIKADGRLMWRVVSNLLTNVEKYAQAGSRVYLDVIEKKDTQQVELIIKNISAYELNVSAEELMERFTRGDESRSTEGSGLGLNIANSLVELQKGQFSLHIDGDLFKVVVTMPCYQEEEKRSNNKKATKEREKNMKSTTVTKNETMKQEKKVANS